MILFNPENDSAIKAYEYVWALRTWVQIATPLLIS